MKIVIAPDSFKDSLSAQGVADAIALGLVEVWPDAQLVKCPMADGGEGTVESILAACEGELRRTTVRGPLGTAVDAAWGWLPHNHTAIIEMAEASGLQLVPPGKRDACISSTFGTGELIRAALDAGAQRVILAIGGSATNDGGAGAMQALGVKLLDAQGQTLAPGGLALAQLARINPATLTPQQRASAASIRWSLQGMVDGYPYADYNFVFNQFGGLHVQLVNFLSQTHPIRNRRDVENYIERLRAVAGKIDTGILQARGLGARGILMPSFITQSSIGQLDRIINDG